MAFTTLVAGSAQAGSQSPVSKPGIGLAAGAGIASGSGQLDPSGEAGFASLVALALDQLDYASSPASSAAGSPSAAHEGAAEAAAANADAHDDASALDAPLDAVTLSVLIALASPPPIPTPVATPAPAPEPAALIANGAAAPGAVSGTVASSTTMLTNTSAVAAGRAPNSDFRNVLASAVAPPAVPAAGGASSVAAPAPAGTPLAAAAAAPEAPTAPEGTASAPAATISAQASAALEALGTTSPASGPGPAPGAPQPVTTPEPAVTASASPAAPRSRGAAPASPHPLRQALAAIAATQSGVEASALATTGATPQAEVVAATPALVGGAAGQVRGSAHDAHPAPVSSAASVASPVAAFLSSADAGSAGEGSSGGGADGGFARAVVARGLESRLDTLAAAAAPTASDVIAAGLPPAAGFGAAGDTLLRSIDAPAALRFEQALSSADPDIRNLQAMVRTVRLFTGGNGASEARLTLEPDHLGPVALTIRVEQGSVSAHFRTDTPAAQRWIEAHQQELRNGLREQGLDVKDLVVTTDPDARRDRRQDAPPARPARARRAQVSADAPRFEVMV